MTPAHCLVDGTTNRGLVRILRTSPLRVAKAYRLGGWMLPPPLAPLFTPTPGCCA